MKRLLRSLSSIKLQKLIPRLRGIMDHNIWSKKNGYQEEITTFPWHAPHPHELEIRKLQRLSVQELALRNSFNKNTKLNPQVSFLKTKQTMAGK